MGRHLGWRCAQHAPLASCRAGIPMDDLHTREVSRMIELRLLHSFVVVTEEGHVTRAAERLGMRQPPLTRLLQGLEARLGCRLLHRLPRGVAPTEAGLALLEEARAV